MLEMRDADTVINADAGIDPRHAAFLKQHGADKTAHSGHTLWQHLEGVHNLLAHWGAARHVRVAGLFHSVYGTQAFKTVTVPQNQRAKVIQLLGQPAETLERWFPKLPRPNLFETSLKTAQFGWPPFDPGITPANQTQPSPKQTALLALECANLLEQRVLHKFPHLSHHAQAIGMLNSEGFLV